MRTPEEIQARIKHLESEWGDSCKRDKGRIRVELTTLRWVLNHDQPPRKPARIPSKIIKNQMAKA